MNVRELWALVYEGVYLFNCARHRPAMDLFASMFGQSSKWLNHKDGEFSAPSFQFYSPFLDGHQWSRFMAWNRFMTSLPVEFSDLTSRRPLALFLCYKASYFACEKCKGNSHPPTSPSSTHIHTSADSHTRTNKTCDCLDSSPCRWKHSACWELFWDGFFCAPLTTQTWHLLSLLNSLFVFHFHM